MKTRRQPILTIVMVILLIVFLYPFYYVLILSFNDGYDAYKGGIFVIPRIFSLENYKTIFENPYLLKAFSVSTARVIIMGIAVTFLCSLYGYAITFRDLVARRFFIVFSIIPMYVSGGLIPFYSVIRAFKLVDKFWVYIIPYLMSSFYILLFRSYFQENVQSLREAAIIDGSGELRTFLGIIMPTSIPVFAVVALYTAVNNWNDWFVGQAFIGRNDLWPLQTVMLQIIKSQDLKYVGLSQAVVTAQSKISPESVRMAMIIVCITPILVVYPFLQKYFIHGIMIGAVKE